MTHSNPPLCPATSVQDLYCFSRAPIATSQERCSAAEPMGVRRCGCMCKCSPDPCSIRRSGHSHLCTVLNSAPALRSSGYHNRSRRSRRPGPVQPDARMLGRNSVRLALGNESRTRFSQCIFLHHCQSATRICKCGDTPRPSPARMLFVSRCLLIFISLSSGWARSSGLVPARAGNH